MFGKLFEWIFRFVRSVVILTLMVLTLMVGMATAGYYLLDYYIQVDAVEVPNLYGMSKTEAMETLLEHQLLLKYPVEEFPSPDAPPGIVVEQRPYPGERVKLRHAISITVSTGAEEILVPDLVGQYEDDALIAIRAAGLEIGQRAAVHHSELPNGMVIAQDPPPGRVVLYSRKVHVLTSLGPKAPGFVMTNFVDMGLAEVMRLVPQLPFQFSEENIEYVQAAHPAQWNEVIAQSPKPGVRVTEGEQVSLTVAVSGERFLNARMVTAEFPFPPMLDIDKVRLMVWDEYAQITGQPYFLPVNVDLFAGGIEERIHVFGGALVMLVETGPAGGMETPRILDSLFFPESGG